jgi:hypothetical protein
MEVVIVLVAFIALDLAAALWGYDSRGLLRRRE